MEPIVLYCKSFRRDVKRSQRLARSVQAYNVENIPFYLSVPDEDFSLFEEHLQGMPVTLLRDEAILVANPLHDLAHIQTLPGGLSQQIIKSEFWRLGLCENYLCIDSDAEFIRDFKREDFLAPDGSPYTLIMEDKEFLTFCERYHLRKVPKHFRREAEEAQALFERPGKAYAFSPLPAVWSRQVWMALEKNLLQTRRISLAELLQQHPYELRLYGEAMLKYRPIPLWPCEPFFKGYLYETQFYYDRKRKITRELLARNYLGIVWQSNWQDQHFGAPQKPWTSRLLKKLKRWLRILSV